MALSVFSSTYDPDEELDWSFDYSDALVEGESILTSTFTGSDWVTLINPSFTSSVATVWVNSVEAGNSYFIIHNRITTSDGRKYDRSGLVYVNEH